MVRHGSAMTKAQRQAYFDERELQGGLGWGDAWNYAQQAYESPMGQAAYGHVKSRFGYGRKGGKGGMPGGMQAASAVANAIPGLADALGPFGALLGLEPPPPPPPHASFGAVAGYTPPSVAARPHGIGRGRKHCPNCQCGVHGNARSCKMCGGSLLSSALALGKKAMANPMVQSLAKKAIGALAPSVMAKLPPSVQGALKSPMGQAALAYGKKKVGLGRKGGSIFSSAVSLGKKAMANPMVQSLAKKAIGAIAPSVMAKLPPSVQGALKSPMGQAALAYGKKKVGLARPRRAPTAHALAVKRVMAEHGMGLAGASRYVKQHGLAHHY